MRVSVELGEVDLCPASEMTRVDGEQSRSGLDDDDSTVHSLNYRAAGDADGR